MLKELAARYQRLIDYFIPDSMRGDRETLNQARMFLISHTMGPILGNTVTVALVAVDPTPGLDLLVPILGITAYWIFPFLLRWGWNYSALVVTSVLNLNLCIYWNCYFNGGVLSPTLPWVLLIPILSFFYIGSNARMQGILMLIFGGSFGLFLAFYYLTIPPTNDVPQVALVSLGVVSTVASLCYVATMAIYYARIFNAGVKLENEVWRRRQAADKLRAAIVAADEAGLHKAEFLARMSHELRTPLNAIIGYSQILKEESLQSENGQMQDDVERIHDAGQYLLRLVNIVLDLSKIEANRMQFSVDEVQLTDVVHASTSSVRRAMREAGNSVDVFFDGSEPAVQSDRQRLLQILGAILDNVSVHAARSHVEIRCQPTGANGYEISVRDYGGGIAPERLATLFEAFADGRDAAASKFGGTGLSLTVVHKLARAMGCQLSVETTVGQGTCFALAIPMRWNGQTTSSDGTVHRANAA